MSCNNGLQQVKVFVNSQKRMDLSKPSSRTLKMGRILPSVQMPFPILRQPSLRFSLVLPFLWSPQFGIPLCRRDSFAWRPAKNCGSDAESRREKGHRRLRAVNVLCVVLSGCTSHIRSDVRCCLHRQNGAGLPLVVSPTPDLQPMRRVWSRPPAAPAFPFA